MRFGNETMLITLKRATRSSATWLVAIVLALVVVVPGTAFAGALEDAKAAGYVGERPDGYLGVVTPNAPASARNLVKDINAKRRAHYTAIAKKNGTSVAAVEAIVGAKLVKGSPPGTYVMDARGSWIRK